MMKAKYQYLILVLIFYSGLVMSQNEILSHYNSIVNADSLSLKQKIEEVNGLLAKANEPEKEGFICYDFGKRIRKIDLQNAIFYTEKACQKLKNQVNGDSETLQKSLNNLIRFYYRDQDYYKALDRSNKLISMLDANSTRLGKTYIIRGHIYRNLGDYSRSIDNHVKSELIFKSIKNKKELCGIYINFLDLYCTLANSSNREEFFGYYNKYLKLSEEYDVSIRDQIKVLLSLGYFYDTLEEYEKAIRVLDKALVLCKDNAAADNYTIGILTDIGVTQKKLGLVKEAKVSFNKALKLSKEYPKFLDDCYNNLAEIYLLENKYEKALEYFDKSVKLLVPELRADATSTYLNNPTIAQLPSVTEKIDVLQYLDDKARALSIYGDVKKNKRYYKLALEALNLSDHLVDQVYYESNEDFSKLFWRKRGFSIYNRAISICHKLNDPDKAFYFIEKSKALVLLDNISELKAKLKANIPPDIRGREVLLQKRISAITKQLENEKANKIVKDSLQNHLLIEKEKYANFVDSLESTFPKYYQYKKVAKTLNVKQVQSNLKNNELVLSYTIDNDKAFLSVVSKNVCQLYRLDGSNLIKAIHNYETLVKKPFVTKDDKDRFKAQSIALFNSLFPFKDRLSIKNKKLIVVGDEALKSIPFESLVVNETLPLHEAYLLNIAEVRYVYSLSSLYKSISDKSMYNEIFLMVNVDQFNNSTLIPLKQDLASLGLISRKIDAKMSGNLATRDQFLESYGNFKTIHISTHGGVSENKPWIAFYDEKLFLDDMYFKNQKAELVTLSACKTSSGEYKTGEGVMSIARGFINAGTKSVYASLWDVDNKSGQELMALVYKNLETGDKKDEALTKAKREYLQLKQNTSEAAPFYWSALVLIGDDAEIFRPFKKIQTVLFLMVLILAVLFILNKNRTKLTWLQKKT